jgi:DNA-binding transcriptional regulator of glucitol operon
MLHAILLAWVGGCTAAGWWQVGRAASGNSLSFLYAIEWPVFGIFGFLGWWALLHMEKITASQERARTEYEAGMRAVAQSARAIASEDPDQAAYNDHLAALAQQPKKKLWGH